MSPSAVDLLEMVVDAMALLICLALSWWGVVAARRVDRVAAAAQANRSRFDEMVCGQRLAQEIDQAFVALARAMETEHQRLRRKIENPQPAGNAGPSMSAAPLRPPAAQQTETTNEKILRLSDGGLSVVEIASQMAIPIGEVELVVKLDSERQKSGGRQPA